MRVIVQALAGGRNLTVVAITTAINFPGLKLPVRV
jgi:hypothetical protein